MSKTRLLIVGLTYALLLYSLESAALAVSDAPDCAIDQGPCTKAGRTAVTFDIEPKPVKSMKELTFTVRPAGRYSAPTMLLELSMPGMYMGRNEVILKRRPDGSYSGKGIIPRCPSGKKLWRAEVTVPGAGRESFIFNVNN